MQLALAATRAVPRERAFDARIDGDAGRHIETPAYDGLQGIDERTRARVGGS